MNKQKERACDLCKDSNGQPEVLHLRSRCHITAPLMASIKGDILTLSCYVPSCARKVAVFKVVEGWE